MNVIALAIPEVKLIKPTVFGDARGFFLETWNRARYASHGIDVNFVQANLSRSAYGVLRGLHYQNPAPQGKLVQVVEGEVFDVAVDIRPDSTTFGQWVGQTLTAKGAEQMYVPPGFAHGFCVLSESALFSYLCTTPYDQSADAGVRWNDPQIGIEWPLAEPSLSAKDQVAPLLTDIPPERLPAA